MHRLQIDSLEYNYPHAYTGFPKLNSATRAGYCGPVRRRRMFRIALKMLGNNLSQSLTTTVGIAVAFFLTSALTGVLVGWCNTTSAIVRHAGADVWVMAQQTPAFDYGTAIPRQRVYQVRNLPGAAQAEGLYLGWNYWQTPDGRQINVELVGVDDSCLGAPWRMRDGIVECVHYPSTVIVDELFLKTLGVTGVGDEVELLSRRAVVGGVCQCLLLRCSAAGAIDTTGRACPWAWAAAGMSALAAPRASRPAPKAIPTGRQRTADPQRENQRKDKSGQKYPTPRPAVGKKPQITTPRVLAYVSRRAPAGRRQEPRAQPGRPASPPGQTVSPTKRPDRTRTSRQPNPGRSGRSWRQETFRAGRLTQPAGCHKVATSRLLLTGGCHGFP